MLLTKTLYFTTSTIVDWVDVFTRPAYKHIIIESLKYCQQNKGLVVHAWVLMSNHLHMVVSLEGQNTLGDIMRDFKKYTSKKVLSLISENLQESRKIWMHSRFYFGNKKDRRMGNYHLWQEGNYIEEIYSYDFLQQKVNYIHDNPVRAEIVQRPEHYIYSSAPSYAGEVGLLQIDKV